MDENKVKTENGKRKNYAKILGIVIGYVGIGMLGMLVSDIRY